MFDRVGCYLEGKAVLSRICHIHLHNVTISSFTDKPLKPLHDFLREYNLPPGLFPQNITCYEFDESKLKLVVHLPYPCEVCFKDQSVVRYAIRVKGLVSRGKFTLIDGMKTKVLVWVKVTSVVVENYRSDKVWFTAGVKKSRPREAYETPRDATRVEEFLCKSRRSTSLEVKLCYPNA
ncbi:hypothetical protein Hdeb2414_s0010g00347801 [Helianthus debilis subsp. tardiflorus]